MLVARHDAVNALEGAPMDPQDPGIRSGVAGGNGNLGSGDASVRTPPDEMDERYEELRRARPYGRKCTVVVFGAAGRSGSCITREAAARGHEVIAVARSVDQLTDVPIGVRAVAGDVTDPQVVRGLAQSADALVIAVGGRNPQLYRDAVAAVITVARELGAHAPRIIHQGGGASLLSDDGTRYYDSPDYPNDFRPHAIGQIDALEAYRATEDVTWTYLSPPPVFFSPGQRTGRYRTGLEHPVVGDDGQARISYEDFAIALVDEIEDPRHLNRRFTVGY